MYWTVVLHIMLELWSSICFTLQDVDSFEPIWCFIIPYRILSSEYDADENKPLCLFMNIYFFQTFNSLVIYPPNLEKAHPPTMNNIFMPKMHSVCSQWVWLSISIIRKPVMRDFWNWVICTVNQNRSFARNLGNSVFPHHQLLCRHDLAVRADYFIPSIIHWR